MNVGVWGKYETIATLVGAALVLGAVFALRPRANLLNGTLAAQVKPGDVVGANLRAGPTCCTVVAVDPARGTVVLSSHVDGHTETVVATGIVQIGCQ